MTMMVEPLPQAGRRHSGVGEMYTIATLGSHSALQILKGAHDEGFKTLAIANRETERLYRSFAFVDEVITIARYSDFMGLVPELEKRKIIIVPHGSFVAYLSLDEHKKMTIPYFGNKAVLDWEASRELQRQWLSRAGLTLPRQFQSGAEIDRPVIVKLYGAQGGKGYMFLRDAMDFEERASLLARQNYILQEYIIGVPLYIHYFYSPLTGKLEIMSMDRRYETNVDSLGRIPSQAQAAMDIDPSYVVVGNPPISLARVDAGRGLPDGRGRRARQPGDLRAQRPLRRVLHRDDHHARHAVLHHGDLGADRRGHEPLHRRLAVLVPELQRADVDRTPHRARDQECAALQLARRGARRQHDCAAVDSSPRSSRRSFSFCRRRRRGRRSTSIPCSSTTG